MSQILVDYFDLDSKLYVLKAVCSHCGVQSCDTVLSGRLTG